MTALGARNVVDPRNASLVDAAFDLSDGVGATVVFDAAGVGAAIGDSLPLLAPRGTIVVVESTSGRSTSTRPACSPRRPASSAPSSYSDDDYDATIANMAAGHYETKGWVEHIPLDDLLEGFDDLRAGRR